jgi:hypothetical protein
MMLNKTNIASNAKEQSQKELIIARFVRNVFLKWIIIVHG